MNQGQVMTAEQVVRETIGILGGIRVPVDLVQEIALPISQAIHNLRAVQDAWARDAQASAPLREEPEGADEPKETGGA